jgi:putative transposase
MPRPARFNLPGIPQHVTQRGNNRQVCFFNDQDRNFYLWSLAKAAHRRDCLIHAYVLMTNHVHLLVTPNTPDGVSRLMQDTGREYVQHVNRTHRRSGTLWEGRFKSSLVESETYCLTCYRYIELNPVRAAMVDTPDAYRWSSYSANALNRKNPIVTPHAVWRSLGKSSVNRCQAYRQLFTTGPSKSDLQKIRLSNQKGLPLGSERFTNLVESQLNIILGSRKIGRPPKKA